MWISGSSGGSTFGSACGSPSACGSAFTPGSAFASARGCDIGPSSGAAGSKEDTLAAPYTRLTMSLVVSALMLRSIFLSVSDMPAHRFCSQVITAFLCFVSPVSASIPYFSIAY